MRRVFSESLRLYETLKRANTFDSLLTGDARIAYHAGIDDRVRRVIQDPPPQDWTPPKPPNPERPRALFIRFSANVF